MVTFVIAFNYPYDKDVYLYTYEGNTEEDAVIKFLIDYGLFDDDIDYDENMTDDTYFNTVKCLIADNYKNAIDALEKKTEDSEMRIEYKFLRN